MATLLKHWFQPPVFYGDEEKTLRARLVDAFLNTFVIYMTIFIIVELLVDIVPMVIIAMNSGGILIAIVLRYCLKRGHVFGVGSGVVVLGFFWITWANIELGTIRTPTTANYILVVTFAGALFGWRGALLSTLASSIAVLGLILAENAGLLPPPIYTVTITQWIAYTSLFALTGGSTFLAMQNLQKALAFAKMEIADRKRVEKALQESEANLQEIFDSSPDNIFVFDVCADGRFKVKKINPSLEKIINAEGQNIEGKFLEEILDPKNAETIANNFRHCIATREQLHYEEFADLPERVYSTSLIPILDETGTVTRLIGISRDITERKQAEDALQKVNQQLSLQLAKVEQLHDELREQSMRDPLTGLFNRRVMQDMFQREFSRARRENYPLSVIMLDMDDLKTINDTYGHQVGDLAIQTLTGRLQSTIRAEDVACRYGGDEFVILLNNATPEDALKRVQQWREALVGQAVGAGARGQFTVQFTAGIASFPIHGQSMEEVINYADVALYRAKAQGRNCTRVFA